MILALSDHKVKQIYIGGERIFRLMHRGKILFDTYVKPKPVYQWLDSQGNIIDEDILSNTNWNLK